VCQVCDTIVEKAASSASSQNHHRCAIFYYHIMIIIVIRYRYACGFTNLIIYIIIYIPYVVRPRIFGTLYKSVTYVIRYPIHILELCLRGYWWSDIIVSCPANKIQKYNREPSDKANLILYNSVPYFLRTHGVYNMRYIIINTILFLIFNVRYRGG